MGETEAAAAQRLRALRQLGLLLSTVIAATAAWPVMPHSCRIHWIGLTKPCESYSSVAATPRHAKSW